MTNFGCLSIVDLTCVRVAVPGRFEGDEGPVRQHLEACLSLTLEVPLT